MEGQKLRPKLNQLPPYPSDWQKETVIRRSLRRGTKLQSEIWEMCCRFGLDWVWTHLFFFFHSVSLWKKQNWDPVTPPYEPTSTMTMVAIRPSKRFGMLPCYCAIVIESNRQPKPSTKARLFTSLWSSSNIFGECDLPSENWVSERPRISCEVLHSENNCFFKKNWDSLSS